MFQRKLFLGEAVLLLLAPALFLAATFPDVWRTTAAVLHLRQTSNPEIGLLQAWSGALQWAAGAYAVAVVAALAVSTARHASFKFGVAFWLGLAAGAASTVLMYGPWGPIATAVVALPTAVLAAHAAALQARRQNVA